MSTEKIPPALVPPIKFSKIEPSLSRGAYPRPINYPYLETLHLKTMIALVPYPITMETDSSLTQFCIQHNIDLVHIATDKNAKDKGKNRDVPIDHNQVLQVLQILVCAKNNPIFIFCNNGGQVSSLVVACLRRIQLWSSVSIYNEFVNFSTTINHNDRTFIENFKAEIKFPKKSERVSWLWNGLSRNITEKHPHLRFATFPDE